MSREAGQQQAQGCGCWIIILLVLWMVFFR